MRPRLLLFALSDWLGPVRLPQALRAAGFEIGLLAEPEGLLAQSSYIDYRFAISAPLVRLGVIKPVLQAILSFGPRLVVPCDEAAVHVLQNLATAFEGAHGPGGQLRVKVPARVREVLLRSLGDSRTFSMRGSRPLLRRAATLMGIAAPPNVPVPYFQVAEDFARGNGWPVVMTLEGQSDGDRMWVCCDGAALREAYADLTAHVEGLSGRGTALRRAVWTVRTGFHLAGDLSHPSKDRGQLAVEPHIAGRQASYAAVAYEGRVLAGIAAVAEISHPAPQIANSIVRLVHDPVMAETARRLIGRMSFTGFCGLDFVREEASAKTWFLKFSPRPTPLSHLGNLAGGDLCAALLAGVTNTFPVPQRATKEMTVALFPQDWMRDPAARERGADHVDMPEGDERLLAALKRLLPAGAVA